MASTDSFNLISKSNPTRSIVSQAIIGTEKQFSQENPHTRMKEQLEVFGLQQF